MPANDMVSLDLVKKCCFSLAKAIKVAPNLKSTTSSYLLTLQLSPALSLEHQTLYPSKKAKAESAYYKSSAQLTSQHTAEELEGALILTVLNFPRKQVGKTMSDCLVTGVMAVHTPERSMDEIKASTVFVRPFPSLGPDGAKAEPGSKIGVLGEEGLIETNPRNLSWGEFTMMKIFVGKVLSLGSPAITSTPASGDPGSSPKSEPTPIPLEIDFGSAEGRKEGLIYLRSGFISPQDLIGRQVLAVCNLAPSDPKEEAQGNTLPEASVLVLTVGGKMTLEPAKEVENGYRLA